MANAAAALAATGSISGSVTDQDGWAVGDIYVTAYSLQDGGWVPVASTYTTYDGAYVLVGLEARTYRIRFRDWDGFYVTQFFDGRSALDDSDDVTVNAGATTGDIDAQMEYTCAIAGSVQDGSGSGIGDIRVRVYRLEGADWAPVTGTFTDAWGDYYVAALRPGTYRVGFEDPNGMYARLFYAHGVSVDEAEDVSVAAGQTTGDVDVVLSPAARITGTVVDPLASGLEAIRVTVYARSESSWSWMGNAFTDGSGGYNIGGLEAGTYRVAFDDDTDVYADAYWNDKSSLESADDIETTSGATVSGIDARLSRSGGISGSVVGSGAALANVLVTAFRGSAAAGWSIVSMAHTGPDGSYLMAGLAPGTYRLCFDDEAGVYSSEYFNDRFDLASADPVVVTEGDTVRVATVELTFPGPLLAALASPTHPTEGEWYRANDVSFSWSLADGELAAGYSYVLDGGPGTIPDDVVDGQDSTAMVYDVADGTWYFHLAAVDGSGAWGEALRYVVKIDSARPTPTVQPTSVRRGARATVRFTVKDPLPSCGAASVTATFLRGSRVVKRVKVGMRLTNLAQKWTFRCTMPRARYSLRLSVRDVAGNRQARNATAAFVVR